MKIYLDTPTFDRIKKDTAAKFVDILSAIGGTTGLLSGFSIICGVEILYFTFRIVWNIMRNKTYLKNNFLLFMMMLRLYFLW